MDTFCCQALMADYSKKEVIVNYTDKLHINLI